MIRKLLFLLVVTACSMAVHADPDSNFDPRQYKTALRQFITARAGLTQQEATRFFVLFDELKEKQRCFFRKIGNAMRGRPMTEKDCLKAIKERDRCELEIKRLQQDYDAKFLKVIPACKLYEVIKAEEEFNRTAFKNMSRRK